jgi:hypothetical protein
MDLIQGCFDSLSAVRISINILIRRSIQALAMIPRIRILGGALEGAMMGATGGRYRI